MGVSVGNVRNGWKAVVPMVLLGMYRAEPDQIYLPAWQVTLGFLVAPGAGAVLLASLESLFEGAPPEGIWKLAILFGFFGAYPAALLVGVPAYVVLRRRFVPRPVNCMLAGAFVAAWPGAVLGLLRLNGDATIDGWLQAAELILLLACIGLAVGMVFWLLVAAGHDEDKVG